MMGLGWFVLAVLVIGGAGVAAYVFWPVRSRRAAELRDPRRQLHWGIVTSYMGAADPTVLERDEARAILVDGWSCRDLDALRRLMSAYRDGELNDAFDAARILWLSELARSAGWMSPAEAQTWSDEACARARRAYGSWAELGEALAIGRRRWYLEIAREPEVPPRQVEDMARCRRDAEPLWATLPW